MEYHLKTLCQIEAKRFLFVVGIVAITHLLCQSLLLPYGNALLSLLPDQGIPIHKKNSIPTGHSSGGSMMVGNSVVVSASDSTDTSMLVGVVQDADISNEEGVIGLGNGPNIKKIDIKNEFASDVEDLNNAFEVVENRNVHISSQSENQGNSSTLEKAREARQDFFLEQVVKPNHDISEDNNSEADTILTPNQLSGMKTVFESTTLASTLKTSLNNITFLKNMTSSARTSLSSEHIDRLHFEKQAKEVHPQNENSMLLQRDLRTPSNNSATLTNGLRKKMKSEMPPKSVTSIDEMNHLLVRHRATSRSMRPRWSSIHDKEILAAKLQIENAPPAKNDGELYTPLFRNASMFRRSYELMERMLKVYIYRDGLKPIFHQPILKGLYASEGWFMKLMEGNKRFIVKDPRKAHLFYMPFSSRMLEHVLYVRNSHNRTNLRQYLKDYSEKIAAKYPFWNRTGGADHFLVACHDWAPYETRHHMERCIKALCNADVTIGFKIGRDVSLPETYVRSARNPLRDLGGKPASERDILAFFAGNMHGYLRPILLKHWKNKDPDMKIFGPMPPGVASKMDYIHYMKSSKYCICPKGYEVNSPRVVEAIFYECVPVIISDNFVPPFFDVLDWGAFSVLVAEKDIPNLKDILLSISKDKFLEMQLRVKKVQQHFLWHAKPVKYDLFHMTLHSIWYNRVFQIKLR